MTVRARETWWRAWETRAHATGFDSRAKLGTRALRRWYEQFNDVALLRHRLRDGAPATFVEVGCATGDMYRYLGVAYPRVEYFGVDISEPAIDRARAKYPARRFLRHDATQSITAVVDALGLGRAPDVLYAKDVVHHQPRPLEFLSDLFRCGADTVVFRCRTKDRGPTEWDPDRSCQYNWGEWTPYIVINVDDLVAHLRACAPGAEIRVEKHPIVLGGSHNRYLPKDCYVPATGTAETAVGVFMRTPTPAAVRVEDKPERRAPSLLRRLGRRVLRG